MPSIDCVLRTDARFFAAEFPDGWKFGNVVTKKKDKSVTVSFTAVSEDGVKWRNARTVVSGPPETLLEGCLQIVPSRQNYTSLSGPVVRPRLPLVSVEDSEGLAPQDGHIFINDPDDPDIEREVPVSAEAEGTGVLQSVFDGYASVAPIFRQVTAIGPPAVTASLKGRDLVRWTQLPLTTNLPEAVTSALTAQTYRDHRRLLKLAASTIQKHKWQDLPLARAVLLSLQLLKGQGKGWKCSTTMKYAASIQGACKILPVHFEGSPVVVLNDFPEWRLGCRTLQMEAKEERPTQALPATWPMIQDAIGKASSTTVKVAILLCWLTAARVGCVLQLAVGDITTSAAGVSITFRHGKGVKARGPYTVHTVPIPKEYRKLWSQYLATRHTRLFSLGLKGSTIKDTLRAAHPQLEQRSIRRGALQAMANNNASEETLMRFSGHTNVTTLRRYLNWNLVNSKVQKEMVEVGKNLVSRASKRK